MRSAVRVALALLCLDVILGISERKCFLGADSGIHAPRPLSRRLVNLERLSSLPRRATESGGQGLAEPDVMQDWNNGRLVLEAQALMRTREYERALSIFKRVVKQVGQKNQEVRALLANMMGVCYCELGVREQKKKRKKELFGMAQNCLKRAMVYCPPEKEDRLAEILVNRGWAEDQLGNPKVAVRLLKKAVTLLKANVKANAKHLIQAFGHLAAIYAKRGDANAADRFKARVKALNLEELVKEKEEEQKEREQQDQVQSQDSSTPAAPREEEAKVPFRSSKGIMPLTAEQVKRQMEAANSQLGAQDVDGALDRLGALIESIEASGCERQEDHWEAIASAADIHAMRISSSDSDVAKQFHFQEAMHHHQKLETMLELQDEVGRGKLQLGRAQLHFFYGKYKEALELLVQVKPVLTEHKHEEGIDQAYCHALNMMRKLYENSEQIEEANAVATEYEGFGCAARVR